MRYKFILSILLSVVVLTTFSISAQETTKKKKLELAMGVATVVGDQKIVLQTKNGSLDAVLRKGTTYFRLPPDNLKISAATDSKLEDISVKDRVLVTGEFSKDRKTIYTVKVYLVKGADIVAQQRKQRQEWRRRGISGRVKSVDANTKVVTVDVPSITGTATTLQISPKEKIKYLRYSPESDKYSDAQASEFSTIQKGDTIQALGDKSADGKSFKAEEILTGSFVTVVGKVKSIDSEKNEVTVADLKTKKNVTIKVKSTALVKRFPQQAAQMMVRRMMMQRMGGGGGVRPPNAKEGGNNNANKEGAKSAGQKRAGGREGGARRGGGREGGARRGAGRGRMDINQMLNRFPTITVAELKVGEMIAVSSPKGTDPTRFTAIKLLAGVEPFVAMATASNSRSGRRGRGGVSGGLTIPGLDSVQF